MKLNNEHVSGVKAMTTGFESIGYCSRLADKGVAIVELAKKLNLDMDQVMAFGDNLNDLHMMQVVDIRSHLKMPVQRF